MISLGRLRAHLGAACAREMLKLVDMRLDLNDASMAGELIVCVRGHGEERFFKFALAAKDLSNNTDEFWGVVCGQLANRMNYDLSERAIAPPPPEVEARETLRMVVEAMQAGAIPKEQAKAIFEATMYGRAMVDATQRPILAKQFMKEQFMKEPAKPRKAERAEKPQLEFDQGKVTAAAPKVPELDL